MKKSKNPEITLVLLSSLIVNPDNARYIEPGQAKDEISAISKLVEIEGDSIIELAKSIARDGYHPTDNLIVSETDEPNKYLILEGNRRITSIKLMSTYNNQLELFSFDNKYKLIFSKLKVNVSHVSVVIYPKGDLRPESIIKQLHDSSSKSGRHRWDPIAQERNLERQKEYTHALALLDMALRSPHIQELIKEQLRSTGRWYSKLQHVSRMSNFRRVFGLNVINGYDIILEFDEYEIMQAISLMLEHMLGKGESAYAGSDYFSSPKRFSKYLDEVFPSRLLPDRRKISLEPTRFNAATKTFTKDPLRIPESCPYYDKLLFLTPTIIESSELSTVVQSNNFDNGIVDEDPIHTLDTPEHTIKSPTNDEIPTSEIKDKDPPRSRNSRDTLISPNDFFIHARHKKVLNLYNSLATINMRHIDLVAIGLRSLIEYSINTYMIEVQNDTKTPYNVQIDFTEKLRKVVSHMSSLGREEYGESELRKRIPKIYEIILSNPKIDYTGIPALHLFVHSHDYNAEKNQVENIYAGFKEFLKIIWEIINTKN